MPDDNSVVMVRKLREEESRRPRNHPQNFPKALAR